MSFSELENETLNQAELNEIKMNEIRQPWNKWSRIRVYAKMSEIHETGASGRVVKPKIEMLINHPIID